MKNKKIVRQVLKENRNGLKRLGDEEPAAERRSKWKSVKRKVESLFESEEKVGHISTA